MRLHEYYFENLGGKTPLPEDSDLYRAIAAQFGSYDDWRKQFGDIAMIRGIGYVILYRDPLSGRLMNVWINEHDLGHLAGGEPLLVLDVWEHAYLTQFGLDRAGYVDTFFKNVDWNAVQKRFSSSKM
jgi:Fe-Mn family superoxide dismutase